MLVIVKKHKKNEVSGECVPAVPDAAAEAGVPPAGTSQESVDDDLRRQLAEANDRYLRSRADLDNFRKRAQRDLAEMRESTKAAAVEEFLPVFDHFNMAVAHLHDNPDLGTLKQGMEMILAEFKRTLEALGVEQVNAAGAPFDPTAHEAISEEASATVPRGHVVRQWKSGYRLGTRLLRPASVVVSSGPAAAAEPPPAPAGGQPQSQP